MKNVEQTLLERRSIRRYERESIPAEKLDFIYKAIRNTPTSYNGQQFSVVAVRDQQMKEEIYEITGQKQIKTCDTFLLFCLDYHKLRLAAAQYGVQTPPFETTIDGYTVGVIDASMAMMSALVAAEAQGLGCCAIGYARTANPVKISELLELPKGVSIVCGLTIGLPRETPDLKPKLPIPMVIHEEKYTADADMIPSLNTYNEEIKLFNQIRTGDQTENDWSGHIADYYRHSMQHGIADYLKAWIRLEL